MALVPPGPICCSPIRTGSAASEPWYLISNRDPRLDLVWLQEQRFCCEQLFRAQKAGIFQLEHSRLRDAARIDLARIGLHRLQQSIVASDRAPLAWRPIPLQSLEPCLPGRAVRRRQHQPWFPRLDLPPPLPSTAATAIA